MTPFTDGATLQALLDVEVALAKAEAEVGVIPASSVADIAAAARNDYYDFAALHQESAGAGNIVIPLVRALTARVATINPESSRYVHYGATSQDIIDTALVLQLRSAVPVVQDSLTRAVNGAAALARKFATTAVVGRTLLQHAAPTTFGLKAAGWLDMMARCRDRMADALDQALVVQFGGASGTLASFGSAGMAVGEALARALALRLPEMPWHTHRDRLVNLAAAFGIVCGALGKIGRDLTLLAQSEVGEAYEAPAAGRGGSSSMPHKQNPVGAIAAVTAAVRAPGLVATMLAAMPQEHERAAGGWQAEWETFPELVRVTAQSADAIAQVLSALTVETVRMHGNVGLRGGVAMSESLVMGLSRHVARGDAMRIVERLSRTAEREGLTLGVVAGRDSEVAGRLSSSEIDNLLRPEDYLGAANEFVARVLQRWRL
jgi:3-carboxy-cis,cis-muconate cycloisomerase